MAGGASAGVGGAGTGTSRAGPPTQKPGCGGRGWQGGSPSCCPGEVMDMQLTCLRLCWQLNWNRKLVL